MGGALPRFYRYGLGILIDFRVATTFYRLLLRA